MLYGHELAHPIELTYLFLVGIGVLAGCIAAICGIINTVKNSATSYPDYHRYWTDLELRTKMKAYEHSYARSIGIEYFDWEEKLTRVKEGKCSHQEIEEIILRSKGIIHSPSVYLDKDIPRYKEHWPKDQLLISLECDFWVNCVFKDWISALKIYRQIQDRGYQLMIEKIKRQSILLPILTNIKP
ncbi:hypothetical protein [Cyclobacterium marinum]|uniref:Uncharacterized protein n=1 Tax=Cyclobacterium marinum (strain ATCC 25205 / DSM 745 / LMG 13164 / NCIMB 1802) TaxID=880070 RepID=G0J3B1_CYCMS|nr:hypothetical protein [Cyclobacterium marinum]AEL24052.1 hypothetical protein Cycma_0271 [Cyclobacterium marinum DSM 745]